MMIHDDVFIRSASADSDEGVTVHDESSAAESPAVRSSEVRRRKMNSAVAFPDTISSFRGLYAP